jgi:uncharacterized protein (TIGR00251 family)
MCWQISKGECKVLPLREEKDGVSFKVRVQPRASKNQVAGIFEDALRVRLTAPPVDGEANEACRAFLASILSVSRGQVEILSGLTGRNKVVKIKGISISEVQKRLP